MKIVTLLAAIWALVGAPSLCRAGVLVECCLPAHHADEESHGCPDDCPNGCPDESPDETPADTGTSNERDCSSCADVCKSMSLAPEKMAGEDFESTPAPVVAATDGCPSSVDASPGECKRWLRERLPFPTSDRPLLI